jgi:hypothetical protein
MPAGTRPFRRRKPDGHDKLPFDFLVYQRDGTGVWEWSIPLFEQSAYERMLRPGQAMSWRTFWDLRNSRGQPFLRGSTASGEHSQGRCAAEPVPRTRFPTSGTRSAHLIGS